MELLRAEKVADLESIPSKTCDLCRQRLELIRTIFDSRTGNLIRMFECKCGRRSWDD